MEVLSQNEIDALLAALSSGEMDAEQLKKEEAQKKIRPYDFKRAVRFSKDHIRSLIRIHENFSRYLTSYFAAQLRTYVQISVMQVEQLPYDEFIRSIPQKTILNIFGVPPLEGRMVLEVNPNVAFSMLDRLLGGLGTSLNTTGELTEIETTVLERIFSNAFDSLQEAWKTVIHIRPKLEALETNPQFMQIVSPNETIVLVSLNAKIGETTGMINLCIPHVVIEPIMPRLSIHHSFLAQKKAKAPEEAEALNFRLQLTKLPIVAVLGESQITVQEFLNLSPGDVIALDRKVNEGLHIKIGNKLKFLGSPGTVKNKMAVRITDIVKEGEMNHDE